MTHCTVCGAAAREGAKFCTSCGARLVDTITAPADEPADIASTSAEPGAIDSPAEPEGEPQETESTWASAERNDGEAVADTEPETDSLPADATETEASQPVTAEPTEYAASWPTGEGQATELTSAEVASDESSETSDSAETVWSSWSGDSDSTVTGAAPASFATDADQDARRDETPEVNSDVADAETETPASAEPESRDPMDESHHSVSARESWQPDDASEAKAAATGGDIGASVRRMLDDLANRIDRMIDPATVGTRGVDADDLADQLTRWSNASTDADGLLEVVRAVRTSPRDVDALTQLADRAPDLELLVRHYQAITGSAGDWATKLRARTTSTPDEA